jgi:hypothetical protein
MRGLPPCFFQTTLLTGGEHSSLPWKINPVKEVNSLRSSRSSPVEARWEPPASAGGATLQRRGKSPTSSNRALAPVSLGRCDNVGSGMLPAPQETRTFFTSFATWERRFILQSNPLCDLLLDVIRENRTRQRFEVHEFVFMRNHVHLTLTPAPLVSLEKAMQFIKGGFSYLARRG